MPRLLMPLSLFLHMLSGERTGIYFIDSTTIPVCHNKRRYRNKVFENLAASGKTSMGYFHGFKLHVVINEKGQFIALQITKGNVDDRVPVPNLTDKLIGEIYADS